jgi:Mrp family chromosome partitioning ATPase
MSDYFRVLKRLERERAERHAPAQDLPERATETRSRAATRASVAATITPLVAPPVALRPASPVVEISRGIAALLDNIRALASGQPTRVLVFAGAAVAEPSTAVARGLAHHAERNGMQVLLGDLRRLDGYATLVPSPGARTRAPHLVGGAGEWLTVDLDGGTAPSDLERWLERTAPSADLVVLTGPPLSESIDAALLARACDGLVIVAESEVTDRRALQVAAERARVAGCRTLGVVLHGERDRMPVWLHRLMGDFPQS